VRLFACSVPHVASLTRFCIFIAGQGTPGTVPLLPSFLKGGIIVANPLLKEMFLSCIYPQV
jgi:hypothetical protein